MRHKNTLFTLVELLVVITIISILAGLLLPALSRAVGQARAVKCASQMKQYGLIFLQYLDDSNNWYPNRQWGTQTLAYIGDRGIGRCPEAPRTNLNDLAIHLSYGYPGVYFDNIAVGFANAIHPDYAVRDSQVVFPYEKCVMVEYWTQNTMLPGVLTWSDFSALNDQAVTSMHQGKCNLLFADSHVKSLKVWGSKVKYNSPLCVQWGQWVGAPGPDMYPLWCPKRELHWR